MTSILLKMFGIYEMHQTATAYIIGFVQSGMLYFVKVPRINIEWLRVEKASRNQGNNLRLRMLACHRKSLIESGSAICLGSADMLKASKYNKGEIFEKIITEYFGQHWEKDNIGFDKDGDIIIDGEKIQIKLNSATLLNDKRIARLA